jgi:hypothetical protein
MQPAKESRCFQRSSDDMQQVNGPMSNRDLGYGLLLDCLDDARDELRQLFERWDNRLVFEGLPLAETYAEGRISIALYFQRGKRRRIEIPFSRSFKNQFLEFKDGFFVIFKAEIGEGNKPQYRDQDPMLIHNIQVVQSIKGIIPSTVRLYSINDEIADFGTHSLYFSTVDLTYKILPFFMERKFDFPVRAGNNRAHHQVEGRVKIMDGISDNKRYPIGNSLNKLTSEDIIPRLSIILDVETVKVGFEKPRPEFYEIMDVLVGPFDL